VADGDIAWGGLQGDSGMEPHWELYHASSLALLAPSDSWPCLQQAARYRQTAAKCLKTAVRTACVQSLGGTSGPCAVFNARIALAAAGQHQ